MAARIQGAGPTGLEGPPIGVVLVPGGTSLASANGARVQGVGPLGTEGDPIGAVIVGGSAMAIGSEVGGGTPGSVLFVDANGDLGQDNANLYWDDTSNQLLVGLGSAANPAYSFKQDTNTGFINSGADDTIEVYCGGTAAFRWREDAGNSRNESYFGLKIQDQDNPLVVIHGGNLATGMFVAEQGVTANRLWTMGALTGAAVNTGKAHTATQNVLALRGIASQTGYLLAFRQLTNTGAEVHSGYIDAPLVDTTNASYKGGIVVYVNDAGGTREAFRVESDGTQAEFGVFGTAAVPQQTVTGSKGGNAALASLLTALAAYGWVVDSTT